MSAVDASLSPNRQALQRLLDNRMALAGLITLFVIVLLCFIGPLFSPYNANEGDLANNFAAPSSAHWLGTDQQGRDLLTRIFTGGQISFQVGILAMLVALTIGVAYGAIAGFIGGGLDRLMMRVADIAYALPFSIFVILLTVSFGRDIRVLFIAIGAVEWFTMARIVRGQVVSLKERAFIDAANVLGQSNRAIVLKHLLPNMAGTIIVYATLMIPQIMMLEAFLSFLGLGVQAPNTSWGVLIKEGADNMEAYPWLLVGPSVFFAATLFSLNFVGDGLRDAFDPRR